MPDTNEDEKVMNEKIDNEKKLFTERQYERLINARNFHYDNFGKWLRFFYLIIGALFIGYYTIHSSDHSNKQIEFAIMILGYIASIACYLSAKGYYYWELSWIQMLHNFEKRVIGLNQEEKVYSVFANKEKLNQPWVPLFGANVSTSKLALMINAIVATVWGAMLLYKTARALFPESQKCCIILGAFVLSAIISYVVAGVCAIAFKSNLSKMEDLELL